VIDVRFPPDVGVVANVVEDPSRGNRTIWLARLE
jgi:hypothetical protein